MSKVKIPYEIGKLFEKYGIEECIHSTIGYDDYKAHPMDNVAFPGIYFTWIEEHLALVLEAYKRGWESEEEATPVYSIFNSELYY